MYSVALNIFAYGWGDAGDIVLNNRKREYLGLDKDENDVLKAPVLAMLRDIINVRINNAIEIKLYKQYIYNKFYNSTIWDEYLEEDSLKNKLPTVTKNIFKENPMLSERIGLMDKYIELNVYEQTGITLPEFLDLRDTDRYYLTRILSKVHESKKVAVDDMFKEMK